MNSVSGSAACSASMAAWICVVERQAARSGGARRRRDRARRIVRGVELAVEHRAAAHLGPVVILGVDPEHRHDGHAVLALTPARASFIAVSALSSVKSGPPNSPACWPVMMTTVRGSARRAAAARAAGGRAAPLLLRGEHARDRRRGDAARAPAAARSRRPTPRARRDCRRRTARRARTRTRSRWRNVESTGSGECRRPARPTWTGSGVGVHRVGTVADAYRYCQATHAARAELPGRTIDIGVIAIRDESVPGDGFPSDRLQRPRFPPTFRQRPFGRFRVLHQIGAGSLGPVFRGEDPHEAPTRSPSSISSLEP